MHIYLFDFVSETNDGEGELVERQKDADDGDQGRATEVRLIGSIDIERIRNGRISSNGTQEEKRRKAKKSVIVERDFGL
jgi:hypothetical protein